MEAMPAEVSVITMREPSKRVRVARHCLTEVITPRKQFGTAEKSGHRGRTLLTCETDTIYLADTVTARLMTPKNRRGALFLSEGCGWYRWNKDVPIDGHEP